MSDDAPKLHIDDDWKSEAAAEKERLADQLEASQSESIPEPSFVDIIQTLAMQAMVGLGGMQGPNGQAIPPNLDHAKHFIDMLDVLEKKTTGNLEGIEKEMLDTTLHQLRLAYVEVVRGAPSAGR
ncbi:MAG: DUF1844 domain-containing protein [Phycisphaerales bacterium]|nr:DUF1844 domain-containing protein [Phycisphaerales bacterium]MCB9863670.1 DUF1844 domain-containing protein [Phycisphaerales bacterium]